MRDLKIGTLVFVTVPPRERYVGFISCKIDSRRFGIVYSDGGYYAVHEKFIKKIPRNQIPMYKLRCRV